MMCMEATTDYSQFSPIQHAAAFLHEAEKAIAANQPFAAEAATREALRHLLAACNREMVAE